jgi:hypothetical protein
MSDPNDQSLDNESDSKEGIPGIMQKHFQEWTSSTLRLYTSGDNYDCTFLLGNKKTTQVGFGKLIPLLENIIFNCYRKLSRAIKLFSLLPHQFSMQCCMESSLSPKKSLMIPSPSNIFLQRHLIH